MADELIYELASTTELDDKPFIHKDWVYCNDLQGGSYGSSQFTISTEMLANSGKYVDYTQGYLNIPIILTASCKKGAAQQDMTAYANEFIMGLKNGYWNIINSLQIQYNNGDLIQPVPLKNMYISYKIHTSFSQDDLNTLGSTLGYYPDSCDSWLFNAASSASGVGMCNNENHEAPFSGSLSWQNNQRNCGNKGFIQRQKAVNYSSAGLGATLTDNNKMKIGLQSRTEYSTFGGVADTGLQSIHIMATIRLKDLSNFFQELPPLLKGATIKLIVNTNTCQFKVTRASGVASVNAALSCSDISISGGVTNPMMVASTQGFGPSAVSGYVNIPAATFGAATPAAAKVFPLNADGSLTLSASSIIANQPALAKTYTASANGSITIAINEFGVGFPAAAVVLTPVFSYITASAMSKAPQDNAIPLEYMFGCSIQTVTNSEHSPSQLKATLPIRLYAPVYVLSPQRESEYLKQGQKKVPFIDVVYYKVPNVDGTGAFTNIVSNGIAGIQKVICIPMITDSANGMNLFGSPFASEPATTSALPSCLTQLNCKIAGIQVLAQNVNYGYEAWLHEMYGIESVNGGLTQGFNSGLIDKRMWENNYQYYVFDASRRSEEEEMVPKGIELFGTNNSLKAIDIHIFVEYKREIVIDLATGARVA